ncbi:MAG: hypothetical protein MUP90_04195 [Gammaproteobacteria bacterium]|nr:hypothetical protein [Gammaproteobacteria bacterium]
MSNNLSRLARLALWTLLGLTSATCYAQQQGFTLRASVEYASGQYGGTKDIEDIYVPITGTLVSGNWGFRATVPYLQVKGPEGTELGPGGEPLPGTGAIVTESGLGDIYLGLTYFDLYVSTNRRFLLDLTGKVKLGTADENKGLGTGETDYSIQLDGYRFFDGFSLFGTLGYKARGQPSYSSLDDVWFASLGGSLPITARTRLGLSLNISPSAYSDREDLRDLSLYLSHWSQGSWRYSGYLSAGFSDSSPEMGAGFSVGYHF